MVLFASTHTREKRRQPRLLKHVRVYRAKVKAERERQRQEKQGGGREGELSVGNGPVDAASGRERRMRLGAGAERGGKRGQGNGGDRQQATSEHDRSLPFVVPPPPCCDISEVNGLGWDAIQNYWDGVCPTCCGGSGGGMGGVSGKVPPGRSCWGCNYCGLKNILDYSFVQSSPCCGDGFMALGGFAVTLYATSIGLIDEIITATSVAAELQQQAQLEAEVAALAGNDSGRKKIREEENKGGANINSNSHDTAHDNNNGRKKKKRQDNVADFIPGDGSALLEHRKGLSPKALRQLQLLNPAVLINVAYTNLCARE